jgi:hypothetical protein
MRVSSDSPAARLGLVLGETIVAVGLYSAMRLKLANVLWPSIE